jgi:hypothetical protein
MLRVQHRLLQLQFKRNHKGGEIKSSYDEEWSYTAAGLLKSTQGVQPSVSYRWDGEMLIGVDDVSTSFGSGKWNGVSIVWFDEAANGIIGNPSMRYHWNEHDREYTSEQESTQVWKWTRHFLASKFGAGEWIVEGSVPGRCNQPTLSLDKPTLLDDLHQSALSLLLFCDSLCVLREISRACRDVLATDAHLSIGKITHTWTGIARVQLL